MVEVGLTVLAVDSVVNEFETANDPKLETDLYPTAVLSRGPFGYKRACLPSHKTYTEVSPLLCTSEIRLWASVPFSKLTFRQYG